jgi:3-oxoacyl-[acyl-carrier-protein] synthase-1
MNDALQMAQLDPSAISYINAHGTGTVNNDLSEGTAIKRLFGNVPRFSSTKGYTGHTLGASGAIEAIFATMAINNSFVFGNAGFENPMPDLDITPQIKTENNIRVDHVLSNSFGFGGNCSSIIFSRIAS